MRLLRSNQWSISLPGSVAGLHHDERCHKSAFKRPPMECSQNCSQTLRQPFLGECAMLIAAFSLFQFSLLTPLHRSTSFLSLSSTPKMHQLGAKQHQSSIRLWESRRQSPASCLRALRRLGSGRAGMLPPNPKSEPCSQAGFPAYQSGFRCRKQKPL